MGTSKQLNREVFISAIQSQLPEVAASWNGIDEGLLHLEVAAYRQCVECAIDEGRMWDVERYCRFLADSLANADDALENAISISFIEDFALGQITDQRRQAVHERMPNSIRSKIVAIDDRWR